MNNKPLNEIESERRKAILTAAMSVFIESGFIGANVDEVVRRAGGSKRTVYKYFESKEGLFAAVIAQLVDQMMHPVEPAEVNDHQNLHESLEALGLNYLDVLLNAQTVTIFRTVVSEGLKFSELANTFYQWGPGAAVVRLSRFLSRQVELGVLQIDDTESAARQYFGMIRSDLHMKAVLGIALPNSEKIAKDINQAVDMFIDAYSPD